ncbi:hypothetical protein PMZ66_13100 [Clostridium paraputrificum]|uniref:hypothetical protein n=1 Tax=Clostridium paraputrificum TaxID=29363 RepID=UPI00232C224B|nr:hypothetical protein [Clostridium paraputrificum]MDB2076548.1 hypothetical protein [Clostridium paraputrificum]MDB2080071.1 hypothetical protein [Clostridium paraputrificum]
MFCSIKRDKKNNRYRFYICDRYRDRETGKVKCSDKYIMSLQDNEIRSLSSEEIKRHIEDVCINKGVGLDNVELILNKVIVLRDVVVNENITTKNNDVVVQEDITTICEAVKIVQAEIVEEHTPTYDTTIMFDVQQMYRDNVRTMIGFNSMSKVFGIRAKERFEIEEEELRKIHEQAESIENAIDNIYKEYLYTNEQNEVLKVLGSEIRLIQDIYICCYDKFPSSEVWLTGAGYIRRIYEKLDFVLPGYGEKLFECWEDIKEHDKLDDDKAYFNHEEYFEEIDLYRESNLDIDKSDITGSLVKMILTGNYEIEYTMSDWIDIKVEGGTIGLKIEHFIDWINNKPTRDYKVTIDGLMEYKKQLYKFKKVE